MSAKRIGWIDRTVMTHNDFATTLSDGRRVIGRYSHGSWSVDVYTAGDRPRMIGHGAAPTRPPALARAGLTSVDADEVLGRMGT
jgi:hypothetical protein